MNRARELAALQRWWDDPRGRLALLRGRRRVGKTVLLQEFARSRETVFCTGASRPRSQELRMLARALGDRSRRDLARQPFVDWDDALAELVAVARDRSLLLILDEFPELAATSPELAGVLRALLDSDVGGLKILLAGSAVRTMWALEEERAPLYGRSDLSLLLHPFAPHEAALLLTDLAPAERARVWTVTGGVPLYLTWWDTGGTLEENLARLVTASDGRLLLEGQLVLATEAQAGELPRQVLQAIAAGRTRHGEINDAVRSESARTLDRLIELRLVERLTPVTEDERRSRRRLYRIADPFLAFWLGVVDRYRTEIERGLGERVLPALLGDLDRHAGPVWEEAVREHLRRMAQHGDLGIDVTGIGRWWRDAPEPAEIDAVVLSGRARTPVLAVEAKWTRTVAARRLLPNLRRRAALLPGAPDDLRLGLAARERVEGAPPDITTITSEDVFARGE